MTRMGIACLLTIGVSSAAAGAHAQAVPPQDFREARKEYDAGEKQMRNEDFEGAVVRFRTAVRLDPGFVLAHYSLGQALMGLKRYAEAVDSYEACKHAIQRESSLDQRARAEADRQRRDEIRELEDSLQRLRAGKIKGASPGSDVAIEQRIRLLKQADLKGAEQQVRVPPELSLSLGSAHFRLGRLEPAEAEYRAAIASDKGLGAAHNNLAVIYMLTGRFDDARAAIKDAEQAGFAVSAQFKLDLEARASRVR